MYESNESRKRTLTISSDSSQKRIRSRKACTRCHQRKTKCSGETPACRLCVLNKISDQCVYLVVEKPKEITVKESYLLDLQNQIQNLQSQIDSLNSKSKSIPLNHSRTQSGILDSSNYMSLKNIVNEYPDPVHIKSESISNSYSDTKTTANLDSEVVNPMIDDKINLIGKTCYSGYLGYTSCSKFSSRLQQYIAIHNGLDTKFITNPSDIYYDSDDLHWNTSIEYQLPTQAYALTLAKVAIRFIGDDYNLVLIKEFENLINSIYDKSPYSINAKPNKIQMCQFFSLLALGELYVSSSLTSITSVPGIQFYKYATNLFYDDFEKPNVTYIETLLLLAFYAHALNRQNSSYSYSGLALRISFTLGLHHDPSSIGITDPVEAERRRRVFWTCYIYDRLASAKLGHPLMVNEEDIDVKYPSMDDLDKEQSKEFLEPKVLNAQIKSAQIGSTIINKIYGISSKRNQNGGFVKNVHETLTKLREWQNQLDPSLRLNYTKVESNKSRSIYSLNMHYNEYIILATRPLFLYVFKKMLNEENWKPSPTTLAIAEACTQAALANNAILNTLWLDGNIARYGYFDAHYIFSSTIILIITSVLTDYPSVPHGDLSPNSNAPAHESSFDDSQNKIDAAINLLKSLKEGGSIGAAYFYTQLIQLKEVVKSIKISTNSRVFRNKSKFDRPILTSLSDSINPSVKLSEESLAERYSSLIFDDKVIQEFLDHPFDEQWSTLTDFLPMTENLDSSDPFGVFV